MKDYNPCRSSNTLALRRNAKTPGSACITECLWKAADDGRADARYQHHTSITTGEGGSDVRLYEKPMTKQAGACGSAAPRGVTREILWENLSLIKHSNGCDVNCQVLASLAAIQSISLLVKLRHQGQEKGSVSPMFDGLICSNFRLAPIPLWRTHGVEYGQGR